jgi:hypothetical protein
MINSEIKKLNFLGLKVDTKMAANNYQYSGGSPDEVNNKKRSLSNMPNFSSGKRASVLGGKRGSIRSPMKF